MKMESGGTVATAANSYVSPPPPPMPPGSAAAAHFNAAAAFQAAQAAAAAGGGPNGGNGNAAAAAAAMAAAQNAASVSQFQEALMSRMHAAAAAGRNFGLTGDVKDLQNGPFSGLGLAAAAAAAGGGGPGRGEGGGFPSLPFLSHMAAASAGQPPFGLHHFVDPRLPFSAGNAFRPFFTAAHSLASTMSTTTTTATSSAEQPMIGKFGSSSAFQPPSSQQHMTKLGKGSPPTTLFSPGQNLFPRSSSAGSGHSPSSSPPSSGAPHHHLGIRSKTDENSNSALSAALNERHDDSISPISLSDSSHHEDERLLGGGGKRLRLSSASQCHNRPTSSSSSSEIGCCCPICGMPLRPSELDSHFNQELDYLTKLSSAISANHRNIQMQQMQQQQGFKSPSAMDGMLHHGKSMSPRRNPIEVAPRSRWDTFQRIQRNRHARIRIKLSRRAGKRHDEVLEEDAPHEEKFTQQQQKPKPINASNQTDDEDIDIVGDDKDRIVSSASATDTSLSSTSSKTGDLVTAALVYGPPQFTEADVLSCVAADEEKAKEDGHKMEEEESEKENKVKKEVVENDEDGEKETNIPQEEDENLEALKARVKKLEGNSKCSKCLKSLKSPVVNVACWHIQCERCWLLSVGTKKSCSLCGMTTAPADLRRVYL